MREILFRGKDVDNGAWHTGQYIHLHKTTYCFAGSAQRDAENEIHQIVFEQMTDWNLPNRHLRADVLPETVGQYTGLTDKNGKRIFEGDIVLFEDESPSNYEYHDCTEMRCGAIEYADNCFYITDRIAVEMEDLIYDGKLDVEIIGNIHDNPELLEGGAE